MANNAADRNLTSLSPEGYTNLEVYLNSLMTPLYGLPGDYNGDNKVDLADYVRWRKGLGTNYTQADYGIWRANFGQTAGSGSGTTANAPVSEPASSLIALLGLMIACLSRRAFT